MGFKLHKGVSRNPGEITFFTGSIMGLRGKNQKPWQQDSFVIHRIRSMFGLSFRGDWYFGLIRIADTRNALKSVEPNKATVAALEASAARRRRIKRYTSPNTKPVSQEG